MPAYARYATLNDNNLTIIRGPARWGFGGFPRFPWFSPVCRVSRKEIMNDELRDKIREYLDDVILNDGEQTRWIAEVDPDFFTALDTFAKRYAEEKSRMEMFRIGVVLGGVYERSKWTSLTP